MPHTPGMPKMPGLPKAPTLKDQGGFPTVQERQFKQVEDISKSDRYIAWQTSHPFGNQYDFEIHDYLKYQKHLSELEFHWLAQFQDQIFDYYFPAKNLVWNLTSRMGAPVRFWNNNPINTARIATMGLTAIDLHVELLAKDLQGALDAAWIGRQPSE